MLNRRELIGAVGIGAIACSIPVEGITSVLKNIECGHRGPSTICELPLGHSGTHKRYEDVPGENACFRIYEWNDWGETWNPGVYEKGNKVTVDFRSSERKKEHIVEKLIKDACNELGPGEVFEIRGKCFPDPLRIFDFGRVRLSYNEQCEKWGLAWYWKPKSVTPPRQFEAHDFYTLEQFPLFRTRVAYAKENLLGGYVLVARLRT